MTGKKTLVLSTLLFVSIFIMAQASSSLEGPQKHALLIGINEYAVNPQRFNLEGCENDVELIRHLMIDKFGFKPSKIRTLKSSKATLDGIRHAFEEHMIKGTKPDDLAVFYFSGHGTRTKDINGDESDGYDEALCPTNAIPSTGTAKNLLTDDEFGRMLESVPAKKLVVILDCCFSGTATKDFSFQGKIKFMEPSDGKDFSNPNKYSERAIEKSKDIPADFPWIALSGCSSWEKSQESFIEVADEEKPCGLLTKCIYLTLNQNPNQTYKEAYEKIKRAVVCDNPSQTPQLEGKSLDELFFGMPSYEPSSGDTHKPTQLQKPNISRESMRFPTHFITGVQGDIVVINIGGAGRTTVGSIFGVYPTNETRFSPDSKIGKIKIASVETLSSTAKILSGKGKITEGCSVIKESHSFSREKLPVLIENFPISRDIRKELEALPYISLPGSKTFTDRIIGPSRKGGLIAVYARDGSLILDLPGKNVDEVMPSLNKALESGYLIKRFSALENPNSNFTVKLRLDQDKTRLKVGEEIGFRFTTTADCYLILAHVNTEGQISILFPNKYCKNNFIKNGQAYEIPPFVDGKYPFRYRLGGPTGQEMVKAIGTRQYMDPWGLDMNNLEAPFKEIKGNPVELADQLFLTLNRKLAGEKPISVEEISIPTNGGSNSGWATDSITYIIED